MVLRLVLRSKLVLRTASLTVIKLAEIILDALLDIAHSGVSTNYLLPYRGGNVCVPP